MALNKKLIAQDCVFERSQTRERFEREIVVRRLADLRNDGATATDDDEGEIKPDEVLLNDGATDEAKRLAELELQ